VIRRVSLLITIYAASLLAWAAIPAVYERPAGLDGYLTVVTELDHEDAARVLREAGAASVITPQTTDVYLSGFYQTELVTLADALARLDPLDPRRDPYIEGLERFFFAGDRRLLYADLEMSPAAANRMVRSVLGPGSSVAEYTPYDSLLAAAFLLLLAGLLWRSSRDWFQEIVLPVLAWLPPVLFGGVALVPPAALGLLMAVFVPGASASRRFERLFVLVLGAAGLVYTAIFAGALAVAGVAIAFAGEFAVLRVPRPDPAFTADPDHKPFLPVTLVDHAENRLSRARLLTFAVLVLVLPPIGNLLVPGSSADHPVVHRIGDLTPASLMALWSTTEPRELPDLADYLAHRAFQEGFPYGREYGFPVPGETVDLVHFTERPDGSYESSPEVVVSFDDAWFDQSIASAPAGIPALLAGLGGASTVVLAADEVLYSGILELMIHVLMVLAGMAPAALLILGGPAIIRRRDPILELARRRRQVA
jgi:hypothetical protein